MSSDVHVTAVLAVFALITGLYIIARVRDVSDCWLLAQTSAVDALTISVFCVSMLTSGQLWPLVACLIIIIIFTNLACDHFLAWQDTRKVLSIAKELTRAPAAPGQAEELPL